MRFLPIKTCAPGNGILAMAMVTVLTELTVSSPISRRLPVIPDVAALAILGSTGDGINGNRIPGGPSFSDFSGGGAPPPLTHSACRTVNTARSSAFSGINTGIVRNAAILAGGYTAFVVARAYPGVPAQLMSDGTSIAQLTLAVQASNPHVSGHAALIIGTPGVPPKTCDLGIGVSVDSWKFLAMSAAGGGALAIAHDVTDGLSFETEIAITLAAITQPFTIGSPIATSFCQTADIAAFGFSTSILDLASLQSISAQLAPALNRRGVIGF
jgi:hypothetical protein